MTYHVVCYKPVGECECSPRIGSSFDSFLEDEGIKDEVLDLVLTRCELEDRADRWAREWLGLKDRHAAFKKLDDGKLRGSVAEAEFTMIRKLLKG